MAHYIQLKSITPSQLLLFCLTCMYIIPLYFSFGPYSKTATRNKFCDISNSVIAETVKITYCLQKGTRKGTDLTRIK